MNPVRRIAMAPLVLALAVHAVAARGDDARRAASAASREPCAPARSAFLDEMALALLSAEAHADRDRSLMLYGQFIGAWDVEVTMAPPDAPPVRLAGEWLFSWALEGRAIQDVWIVPPRTRRDLALGGPRPFGTTLRFPDATGQAWRIVWVNPVSRSVVLMTARAVDGEIVQEGVDDDGQRFRWVFHAIERDRFRWRAEDTADGKSWTLRQEMLVTRRTGPSSRVASTTRGSAESPMPAAVEGMAP